MATHIRKRDLYNPTPRESAHDINRIRRQIRAQQSLQIERHGDPPASLEALHFSKQAQRALADRCLLQDVQ
jgi:hypothetical protein